MGLFGNGFDPLRELKNAADAAGKAAGDAANAIGDAAAEAAKNVGEAAGNAAGAIAEGASSVGEQLASSDVGKAAAGAADAIGQTAAGAADAVSHAAEEIAQSDAAKAVAAVGGAVGAAAAGAVAGAGEKVAGVVGDAAAAVDSGVKAIKENTVSARLRKARIAGFRDGLKQGAYLSAEKRYNFYYAYVATLCYFMRCDGDFSDDERQWLSDGLDFLRMDGGLPDEVKDGLQAIGDNEQMTFDEVKEHLDKVSLGSLDSITEYVQLAIDVDGKVSEEEEHARRLYLDYVAARAQCLAFERDWTTEAIEKSVREYGENLERINRDFKEKTKLQDADVAFLMGATMLQVVRVLVINSVTEIERAGQGNVKEKALHDFQDNLFSNASTDGSQSSRLYASRDHIITARGVPYDATRYEETNFKLFKGANHRFATLGHDPVLGLVFGTSNIMTNTISCVKDDNVFGLGLRIPVTHQVVYDALGKNPCIGDQVGSVEMLVSAGKRVVQEPDAAAAALIKQLIHIGTDLYTPCGIQIPFANLVLDKKSTEMLTKYISTGDLLKVGVQTGMTVLINWLIAALHGCSLIFKDDGTDYCTDLYQSRTKKILLLSNAFATSSSVLQAAILNNPKCLDLGGAAVLVYNLFKDVRFIAKLKEEYVNSELANIYDERAAFGGLEL